MSLCNMRKVAELTENEQPTEEHYAAFSLF